MVVFKDISGFTGLIVFLLNRCLSRALANRWTQFGTTLVLTLISFIIELIAIFIGSEFTVFYSIVLILGIMLFSTLEYILPFLLYRRNRLKDKEIDFRVILLINKTGDLANLLLVGFVAVYVKYSTFSLEGDIHEDIVTEDGVHPIIFLYWWYFMLVYTALQLCWRLARVLQATCMSMWLYAKVANKRSSKV
jgi:hypothetical protein